MFCSRCQEFWRAAFSHAAIPDTVASCEDIKWKHYEMVLHGTIQSLKHASNSSCPICRAILFTPTTWEKESLLAHDYDPLDIVLDIDPGEGPHPVLSASFWDAGTFGVSTAARIPKRMLAACAGLISDQDLATTLDRCRQLSNSSTGSDAALELAAFWLKRCTSAHEKCRATTPTNTLPFTPTRLLDLSRDKIRLVETAKEIQGADADRRFVALSHCWGKIKIIITTNENYHNHVKNVAPSNLSKTFREAVHTTRRLGFRYLWIDSLCIIQNNDADWAAEAATMCDVYRNAALTIAAAHASGGDVGCFEDRDGILQFPFIADVPTSSRDADGSSRNARILFTSYGRGKGLGGPEPPLYGRAWVLQEQLLSPRMLIFDGSQIRWECLSMHGSERSPQGGLSRHIGHQKAIRSGIMDDVEFFNLPEFEDRDFSARAQHQHWCYAIMDYTHRGMTKPFDRLVAIDGIAKALSRKTQQKYLAGLWSQHFWIGLLWSLSHRREFTPTTMDAFDFAKNPEIRHKEPLAPSWSWVSVTAPVVYPVPAIMFVHRISEILSTHTSGTPAKQTGRVKIRGHLRTGYINSIYPYAIREAAKALPSMITVKPTGGKELFTYRGRSFHPNDFFIFSDTKPTGSLNQFISLDWRLVRGAWRPDQVLDPQAEITFITIAQQNVGTKEGSPVRTYDDRHPLQTYTLGLIPTGRIEGEYTRVGYGVWEDCAWYGYNCGHKSRTGRELEKSDGWRGMLAGRDLEKSYPFPNSSHKHYFQPDRLPDISIYDKATGVQEKVLVIV